MVDWVLSKPKRDCLDSIYEGIEKASDAALSLVDKGLEKTQQEYN